jgi:hypothetical protein
MRMRRRLRWCSPWLIAVLCYFLAGGEALAKVVDITWGMPIIGQSLTYAPVDDDLPPCPQTVTSYQWSYQYDNTIGNPFNPFPCKSAWYDSAASTSPTISFFESTPGPFRVRLTVKYAPQGFPPTNPPDIVITKTINIPEADSVRISHGIDPATVANLGTSDNVEIDFTIRCCGQDAGALFAGYAQEFLRNKHVLWPTDQPQLDDPDWSPTSGQDNTNFNRQGNVIVDMKGMSYLGTDLAWWSSIPVGTTFYSCTQDLRLMWSDPCGNTRYMVLGSVLIRRVKVGDMQWEIQSP